VPQITKEAVFTASSRQQLSLLHPFLLYTTFAMAFSLNGTRIEGGTFNSVAGNMSQVFNSHVCTGGTATGPRGQQGQPTVRGRPQVHSYNNREQWLHWANQKSKSTEESGYTALQISRPQIQHVDDQPESSYSSQSPTPEAVDVTHGLPVYPSHLQRPLQNQDAPAQGWTGQTNSNTFNSVVGDMTQLTMTSYGESGIDCFTAM
ncbi:hypothetical protein B0H14DRAFT_1594435, partial [Mycena olivaceomarginata]